MKKFLVGGLFAVVGLAAFAGTCTVSKVGFTTIGTHDTAAGQIDNNSGVNILQHKIKVAFLNDANSIIEIKTVNGCLRSLQDGTSDFYSVAADANQADTTHSLARLANFEEDTSFKIGTTTSADLTVTTTNIARTGTSLTVTGTIKNNGANLITSTIACIVVRDTDGNVIIVGRDDVINDLATSGANQTQSFSVTLTVPSSSTTVKTVDVWVDGIDDSNSKIIKPQSNLGNTVKTCGTATATPSSTGTAIATSTGTVTPANTAVPPTATTTPPAATNTPAATSTPCGG